MRFRVGTSGYFLFCISALAQTQRTAKVCNTFDASDCYSINTSVIGGVRFEDYKVTNQKDCRGLRVTMQCKAVMSL